MSKSKKGFLVETHDPRQKETSNVYITFWQHFGENSL